MLKISHSMGRGNEGALAIEGTLGGAWVAEVRSACDALLKKNGRVVLDLSGVAYVDRAGVELLGSLQADGRVVIQAASAFVAELLKGGAA
jgi:ABC-type transporter Mla MlaB component